MGVFDMVVVIVVIGCLTGVISDYLKTRRAEVHNRNDDDLDEILERLEHLDERMRVVETIVTDSRTNLSKEIDSL